MKCTLAASAPLARWTHLDLVPVIYDRTQPITHSRSVRGLTHAWTDRPIDRH